MYCKATNIVNKTVQYLNKSHSILKDHNIFDRFKIEKIEEMVDYNDDGELNDYTVISYKSDDEYKSMWLRKEEYSEITRYPTDTKDTIFFLYAMHRNKYYPEDVLNPVNLPFNKEEMEILALTGNFFIWNVFYAGEISGSHVDVPNMKLFSKSEYYELANMINLPVFDIGGELPSFKIDIISSDVVLFVIEPKITVETESKDQLIDYLDSYMLKLTFGKEKDIDNLNEERLGRLFTALEGKVVSADTNLRDLYFSAGQYLRFANIKEEKLVSITVEEQEYTTRYLGGLYSGFSMNAAKIDSREYTTPFPITDVAIGGQKVTLACSMSEIETALGLN